MKVLVVIDKNKSNLKETEKLYNAEIITASFDRETNADFVANETITNPLDGYNFLSNVYNYTHPDAIFFADSILIKEAASYFAGKNGLGLIAHSKELKIKDNMLIGYVPGGSNVFAEVVSTSHPVLLILRSNESKNVSSIKPRYVTFVKNNSMHLESEEKTRENPLKSARIVIGIGRGVKPSLFPYVKDFAKNIGAEIGCTRPLVDIGLFTEEKMIGETGISISPQIYIALGISGALQHIVGVNAKYIISVNTDPYAPIFAKSAVSINQPVETVLKELKGCLRNFSR